MSQLILRTFGFLYVILSLITMITPNMVANSFFQQYFHHLDIDNYSLIIMDLFRLIGVFVFISGALMIGISRSKLESLTFFNVAFMIFSVIGLLYSVFHAVLSREFRWKFTSSACLVIVFLAQVISMGYSMFASSRRRNQHSTSLPSSNSYSMGFNNQSSTPYNPNIHTNYYNAQPQMHQQQYQQASWNTNSSAFGQSYNGFNNGGGFGQSGFDTSFGSDMRKRV
ncbi:predicted protein [Naegleria gruberi]|uniref:Predicted protein n=1 Tax=Naegleria gruberi TaxID=5762 RepID=D2VRB0_NAEGR|nr:uncharacterized protein NAEGRDRAFT_71522 [Naegleria gruberi]EFC40576.1 predicted protein [Naegleria gruberi]|eukprot:XP_002673320.1 predicted protein [Naegleria gruberi strain NEG-M]